MKYLHKGKIQNGKIIFENKERFLSEIVRHEGRPIVLTISKPKNKRSLLENNYYWGVVVQLIADHTGQDMEIIHELLKYKFLKKKVVLPKKEFDTIGSTAELSTKEFEDYLVKCRAWATDFLDLFIPLPNEVQL